MKNNFKEDLKCLLDKYGKSTPDFAYGQNLVKKNFVPYSGVYFDENESLEFITEFVYGKWAVAGENVRKFEEEFSRYVRQSHSVMVNSGSSANLILLSACKKHFGWKNGDKILTSIVGFPTTVSAITINGLTPVFADIEFDSLNFDLNLVENELKLGVKAIFVSPVLGNPPDIDKLIELGNKYNCVLLLDGCDSLGSKWSKKHLNEYFFATSCSFFPAHHISTLQGGMISSNNYNLIKTARSMSAWGRACFCVGEENLSMTGACGKRFSNWLKSVDCNVDHKYVYGNLGYNLQPLDVQGALGIAQLNKIEEICEKRIHNVNKLKEIFRNKRYVKRFPEVHKNAEVSWFGFPLVVAPEHKPLLVKHLESNGIQTRNYFAGNIASHPAYASLADASQFPQANRVLKEVFFIGCAPFYTDETLKYIETVVDNYESL